MSDEEDRTAWCKIIQSPKHGSVLVTRGYDEDDEPASEKVNIEFRSKFCITYSWGFHSHDDAQRAFDGLTEATIDAVRGGVRSADL